MCPEPLTIVYVAAMPPYGTCFHRAQALVRLGHTVIPVSTAYPRDARLGSIWRRAVSRVFGPVDDVGANRRLLGYVQDYRPEVVWVDKGLTISAATLVEIHRRSRGTVLIHYSPDDMLNPRNQSRRYLECIPLYDIHVTTKSANRTELRDLGARRVLFVNNAFCPVIHRPADISADDQRAFGGPVGFVGDQEEARYGSIRALGDGGIPVRVWGHWSAASTAGIRFERRWLYNRDYAKAVSAFDVNLCFLRKENRDAQTTRSVEIPACGGFMLAERTREHLALFEEDREAVYFGSNDELVDKARYWTRHESERRAIANAGRARCLASGYSNDETLSRVLAERETDGVG